MDATTTLSDHDMVTAAKARCHVVVDRPDRPTITARLICWKSARRPSSCTVQLSSGAFLTVPASTITGLAGPAS